MDSTFQLPHCMGAGETAGGIDMDHQRIAGCSTEAQGMLLACGVHIVKPRNAIHEKQHICLTLSDGEKDLIVR